MRDNDLTLKLDKSRWWVLQNSPFYGQLVMSLKDTLGNPHGKTACTDGKGIKWDREFLDGLTDEETRYVLLHETAHCAYGHLWRFPAGACDHSTANQACDHAINLTLNNSGLEIAMPKGGLADNQFSGMAEEEIYAAMSRQPEKQDGQGKPESGSGQGDDPCGDFTEPAEDDATNGQGKPQASGQGDDKQSADKDAPAGSGDAGDTLKDQWERKVIQAAMAQKASGIGNCPADMQRVLDKLAACPIDWRQETAAFAKNAQSSRNDWTRSPRRHAWQKVVYPSRRKNEVGLVIAIRDTSGSIDDKLAAEFSAIIAAACAELNCELLMIDCDARIQAEYRIEPGNVPLTAKGGGGTDFTAIESRLEELANDGEQIAGIITLTDLYGSQFNPGDIASLWLVTNSQQSTHGRTVQIL